MIGIIIQARLGSTRLPKKVLMDICGKPALQRVIERCQKIKSVDKIVVATHQTPGWTDITDLAWSLDCDYYALGEAGITEDDVLSRYYKAAKNFKFNPIIRITADCPMLDPVIAGLVLESYNVNDVRTEDEEPVWYSSNVHPATFPDGLDVEIFAYEALKQAYRRATDFYDREHVTPFIWHRPKVFNIRNVTNPLGDLSHHRWTLDTQDDLDFIRKVYETLGKDFTMEDVLALPFSHTLPRPAYM